MSCVDFVLANVVGRIHSKRMNFLLPKAVGDDQDIPFSTVASRNAYIPEVISPMFPYPLIACKTDDIDPELYEW